MCKNCDDCYWRSEVNEDYCFATQNKITNEGCDNYKSSSDICDDMKNKWERFDMKESKELKDLLTTGVIVEICNEIEGEDTIKNIGVVMRDIILYDNGYDLVDRVVEEEDDYYINKVYSPNKKCRKLEGLLDYHNSDIIWEKDGKPNRLTREEFAKLPLGTKIIGINKSKNMEELEFVKIKDFYLDNAVLCLSNYRTYNFFEFGSIAFYLKEEYEEHKKELTNN